MKRREEGGGRENRAREVADLLGLVQICKKTIKIIHVTHFITIQNASICLTSILRLLQLQLLRLLYCMSREGEGHVQRFG